MQAVQWQTSKIPIKFEEGEVIIVTNTGTGSDDWWLGKKGEDGRYALFPITVRSVAVLVMRVRVGVNVWLYL